MKELQIGEEIRIKCVETTTEDRCYNCAFYAAGECYCAYVCNSENRSDHKNVHFEIIEKEYESN